MHSQPTSSGGLRELVLNSWALAIFYNIIVLAVVLLVIFFVVKGQHGELSYAIQSIQRTAEDADEGIEPPSTLLGVGDGHFTTTVLVAIWNSGQKPIQLADVVTPIVLETDGGTPLLEARLSKETRESVRFDLDTSKLQEGTVGISWSVLNPSDGAVVQVRLAGGPEVDLSVAGTIEGQPEVRFVSLPQRVRNSGAQSEESERSKLLYATLAFIEVLFLGAVVLPIARRAKSEGRSAFGCFTSFLFLLSLVLLVVLPLYLLSAPAPVGPPFEF